MSPNAGREAWIYLSLSGVVGFVIGDLFLFRAFVLIGARLSMLIYSSVPPITAIIGFFFLGERMKPISIAGMLVTVVGIAIAVLGRKPHEGGTSGTAATMAGRTAGILLAFGGSIGQAVGVGGVIVSQLVMSKFLLAIILTACSVALAFFISLTLKEPQDGYRHSEESPLAILREGMNQVRSSKKLQWLIAVSVLTSTFSNSMIGLYQPHFVNASVSTFWIGASLSLGGLLAFLV